MTENGLLTMDDILKAEVGAFCENGNLRVSVKKTVNMRQYETEVIEADISVPVTAEQVKNDIPYIATVLTSKLQYSVLFQLYATGRITPEEFFDSKSKIEASVNSQKAYHDRGYTS